jgi:alditol oxidase
MDKRTFIKTSSVFASGLILSPFIGCKPSIAGQRLSNWAGNLTYTARNVHYPSTVTEVQELVKRLNKCTALGSRHSFNKIADSTENQISLQNLNRIVSLDRSSHTVTVEAGMRYGELSPYLHENGYALNNLASLPHITVAGACATATHGSGITNGNLSTAVSAIEFINASGDVIVLSKDKNPEQFYGAVVALGAIGIVTKVTLDLQPTFNMKQFVYRNMPMEELKNNFSSIMANGYSVSMFTDWNNRNINEVWIKSKVDANDTADAPSTLHGASIATRNMHPVESQSAENVTDQMGVAGPWYERMPHFKMGFRPSSGKELQSEYFVPIEQGYEAMMAVEELSEEITPHLFISEIRTIQKDSFWLSPCYKKHCVSIHTTWKQEVDTVNELLPLLEKQLAPFNPMPHWAKLFALPPAVLQSRIEKLADFRQLADQYDPNGKFRNEFLNRNIFEG